MLGKWTINLSPVCLSPLLSLSSLIYRFEVVLQRRTSGGRKNVTTWSFFLHIGLGHIHSSTDTTVRIRDFSWQLKSEQYRKNHRWMCSTSSTCADCPVHVDQGLNCPRPERSPCGARNKSHSLRSFVEPISEEKRHQKRMLHCLVKINLWGVKHELYIVFDHKRCFQMNRGAV